MLLEQAEVDVLGDVLALAVADGDEAALVDDLEVRRKEGGEVTGLKVERVFGVSDMGHPLSTHGRKAADLTPSSTTSSCRGHHANSSSRAGAIARISRMSRSPWNFVMAVPGVIG